MWKRSWRSKVEKCVLKAITESFPDQVSLFQLLKVRFHLLPLTHNLLTTGLSVSLCRFLVLFFLLFFVRKKGAEQRIGLFCILICRYFFSSSCQTKKWTQVAKWIGTKGGERRMSERAKICSPLGLQKSFLENVTTVFLRICRQIFTHLPNLLLLFVSSGNTVFMMNTIHLCGRRK